MKSFHIDRNMKDKVKIRLAIEKVCKSKKKRNGRPTKKYRQAQKILANIDRYTDLIHTIVCETEEKEQAIKSETYRDGDFPNAFVPHISGSFTRKCENGKVRVITSVPVFPDQIIHQLVIKSAESVFMRGMYRFSCGSIPKRGVHKGKQYLERYISRNRRSSAIKYAAQLDIRKCYPHIRHDVLKEMLRRKFRGSLFLWFCFSIIDSYSEKDAPGVGLPIGFYTSQWFCNFLLTPLDTYIKQELKVKCHVRYVDDMTMFSNNKKKLHRIVDCIIEKAASMGLQIKDNWQVFRFDHIVGFRVNPKTGKQEEIHKGRAIDTLGFRFFRNKTILRKRNALSIRRCAARLAKAKRITPHRARSFMSKIGALKHCNSRNFWQKYVKPLVKIKKLKEIIRNEDRKQHQTRSAGGGRMRTGTCRNCFA